MNNLGIKWIAFLDFLAKWINVVPALVTKFGGLIGLIKTVSEQAAKEADSIKDTVAAQVKDIKADVKSTVADAKAEVKATTDKAQADLSAIKDSVK